jgi:hypothetical protein
VSLVFLKVSCFRKVGVADDDENPQYMRNIVVATHVASMESMMNAYWAAVLHPILLASAGSVVRLVNENCKNESCKRINKS